jgi:hypothetical protein
MSRGKGKIGDKVHGDLFEREGGGGFNGVKWGSDRVCANLILLANGTTCYKVGYKGGKTQPPEISFNNCFSMKASKVTGEGRRMNGMEYLRSG